MFMFTVQLYPNFGRSDLNSQIQVLNSAGVT